MGYPPQGAGGVVGGIRKLSELEIDTDKDWLGFRIRNIGAPLTDADVPRARAEDILSGVFSLDRIPTITREKIVSPLTLSDVVLESVTVDPTLRTGRIWMRTDLQQVFFSPDGSKTQTWLKKIGDVNVASDVSYVDINGLDINRDRFYFIVLNFKNPTASGTVYKMYIEGNYTDANYYTQWLQADGTTVGAGRDNYPGIGYAFANTDCLMCVWLVRTPRGYPYAISLLAKGASNYIIPVLFAVTGTVSVTNITQIRISSSVANGIGAGSRLSIYGGTG
jgi:hypothetical protein